MGEYRILMKVSDFTVLCDFLSINFAICSCFSRYIQAATSPKDIVILMDASGSMTGLRMEIARHTVRVIIKTLSDDDFFNVIVVNTIFLLFFLTYGVGF